MKDVSSLSIYIHLSSYLCLYSPSTFLTCYHNFFQIFYQNWIVPRMILRILIPVAFRHAGSTSKIDPILNSRKGDFFKLLEIEFKADNERLWHMSILPTCSIRWAGGETEKKQRGERWVQTTRKRLNKSDNSIDLRTWRARKQWWLDPSNSFRVHTWPGVRWTAVPAYQHDDGGKNRIAQRWVYQCCRALSTYVYVYLLIQSNPTFSLSSRFNLYFILLCLYLSIERYSGVWAAYNLSMLL